MSSLQKKIGMPADEFESLIDKLIGEKLKQKRITHGLSQADLAEKLGITYQQVQKYEWGLNRISGSKLYCTALAINEPVSTFFTGLPNPESSKLNSLAEMVESQATDRESLEFIRLYNQIKNPQVRKKVREVLRALLEE